MGDASAALRRLDGRLQVFWGSGYGNFGFGTSNDKLYAFSMMNERLRRLPVDKVRPLSAADAEDLSG